MVAVWGLLTLLVAAVGTFALAQAAVLNAAGQELDQAATDSLFAHQDAIEQLLSALGYISIGSSALAIIILVVLALVRRRFAVAVAAFVLIGGANLSTQLIKRFLLDRPDFGNLTINSLPSGHTTVTVSLVLAAVLVAPRAARPVIVAIGSFAVMFIGASTVVAGWHRPSDVLAACAVTLAWGGLVVMLMALRRPATPATGILASTLLAVAGVAVAGVVLVLVGVRPYGGWDGVEQAIVTLGVLALCSAVTVAWFARLSATHAD